MRLSAIPVLIALLCAAAPGVSAQSSKKSAPPHPLPATAAATSSPVVSDSAIDALADAGHWKRAKAAAETRLKANVNDGVALWILARVSEAGGDLDGARKYAEQAVAINPQSAQFHAELSGICGQQAEKASIFSKPGLASKFRKEAETAAQLDAKNLESRIALLEFYYQAPGIMGGDKKKAYAMADEIAKINPAEGFKAQARLARNEKKPELLEGLYQKAVAADGSDFDARMGLASIYSGDNLKKYDLAIQQVREAMKLDPGRASPYSLLAALYVKTDKLDDLEALLAQAEKNCPDNIRAYLSAGANLTLQNKDLPRGEKYIRKYLSQDPEIANPPLATAHWRLGQNLEKQGRKQDAINEYQTAVNLKPDFEDAKKDLKRLK